jgi:hypothetical protein
MTEIDWKELIDFYDEFSSQENYKEIEGMKKFVILLVKNRNLQNLHYFTSHETLCITKFKTHPDWFDKPLVTIDINWGADEQYKYKFSLVKRQEEDNVLREFAESEFCSFDKSLKVFDEMIEKLEKVSK